MPIKRKMNLDASYKTNIGNKTIRTISDFLNTEYREYSNYVIETRAIPSIMDGFKTGARKVLHSAFTGGLKDGSEKKLLNLVGDVYNKTLFAHGDAGLVGAIMTMGASFSDNLNALDIVGQGGCLRDPKSFAAPRYLYCKLSKYAKLLYKVDEDLLTYVFDEGEYLEPVNYLPIIPVVLTSRTEGMAPGYKFSSFSYNPLDIIDACTEVLKNGKQKTIIRPYVRGIKQNSFAYDSDTDRWYNIGEYSVDEKNDILRITDLPYDVSYDRFEKKLKAYKESGYIKDFKNFTQDDKIDYRILFNKSKLASELQPDKKAQFIKKFMLQSVVPADLLYVLDENRKVKHFLSKEDLLEYFVKLRLKKYNDRKSRLVAVKEKQLEDNTNLCKFIELVTSGKLVLNNRKMADVKKDLDRYKIPYTVLSVQVSKLTQEEKEEILKKNKEIEKELEYIKNTAIEQMYLDDLKNLRKELTKDFE